MLSKNIPRENPVQLQHLQNFMGAGQTFYKLTYISFLKKYEKRDFSYKNDA